MEDNHEKKIYRLSSPQLQIGVVGDYAHIEGGVHFYHPIPQPPLQRPLRPMYFIGREMEIDEILNYLRPGRIITLCGPGGLGKTAIAVEIIWRLSPDDKPPIVFPDGIVSHSFYDKSGTGLALEHIIRSFDPQAQDISGVMKGRAV